MLGVAVARNTCIVVGDQRDAQQAAEKWRFLPKAFKKYYNIPDPGAVEQRAEAELPPERVYGEWPVGTEPAVHIDAIAELLDSGATIVNIHSGQPDQQKVLDFYGRSVLPKFRPRPL
jgi:F420-dependent hydroxymycolic acid dehydrogenase